MAIKLVAYMPYLSKLSHSVLHNYALVFQCWSKPNLFITTTIWLGLFQITLQICFENRNSLIKAISCLCMDWQSLIINVASRFWAHSLFEQNAMKLNLILEKQQIKIDLFVSDNLHTSDKGCCTGSKHHLLHLMTGNIQQMQEHSKIQDRKHRHL